MKYLLWALAPQTLIWRSYKAVSCSVSSSSPSIFRFNLSIQQNFAFRNWNLPIHYWIILKLEIANTYSARSKFFSECAHKSMLYYLLSFYFFIIDLFEASPVVWSWDSIVPNFMAQKKKFTISKYNLIPKVYLKQF